MRQLRQEIKDFIIQSLGDHPRDVSRLTADRFKVNRRTVNDYLGALQKEGLISAEGRTKSRVYRLLTLSDLQWEVPLTGKTEEHEVWRETVAAPVANLPPNLRAICEYGFKEMFNNVIDHSEAKSGHIQLVRNAASVTLFVLDSGVGIFEKIRAALGLLDPREGLLELSKGKLTTAPTRHSGEGIFFTSRMFDRFSISSRGLVYLARPNDDDWLFEMKERDRIEGTVVMMELSAFTHRTPEEVFNRFAGEEKGFFKTHVPVALARYGQENLVSRSQARRVLARFDKFKEVVLDFDGVPSIGQPFADEIFRVFVQEHPEVTLVPFGANADVQKMIDWVRGNADQGRLL